MISYELAKQLKDAGFQNNNIKDGYLYCGLEGCNKIIDPLDMDNDACMECGTGSLLFVFVCAPTLEELIEACGKEFVCLESPWAGRPHWYAGSGRTQKPAGAHGKTPLEAVARLWLAINPKKI